MKKPFGSMWRSRKKIIFTLSKITLEGYRHSIGIFIHEEEVEKKTSFPFSWGFFFLLLRDLFIQLFLFTRLVWLALLRSSSFWKPLRSTSNFSGLTVFSLTNS